MNDEEFTKSKDFQKDNDINHSNVLQYSMPFDDYKFLFEKALSNYEGEDKEEFYVWMNNFARIIIKMSQLDFSEKFDYDQKNEILSYLSLGINVVIEELADKSNSNSYLQYSLDLLEYPVVITNEKDLIKSVNKLALELIGYRREELVGQPISKILTILNSGKLELDKKIFCSLKPNGKEQIHATVSIKGLFNRQRLDGYFYRL